jgi:predicted amidohydrolase
MHDFKIAAGQIASVRGDLDRNIATHAMAMAAAAAHGVSVLVFPELSLTGYEPDLAAGLAISVADERLAPLIALARRHQLATVVGAPLYTGTAKPFLGAILLTASGATRTYHKMHLGGNESIYFTPGATPCVFAVAGHTIGIAICADSAQESHPQSCADLGANIYAAGVFLNKEWYATDVPRLARYAERHGMLTLMANHADSVGTFTSVGKSAVWAPLGALLAQTEGAENALVIATSRGVAWEAEVTRI